MLTRNPKAATRRARSCHSSSVNDRLYHGACSSEQLRRGRLAQLVRALP